MKTQYQEAIAAVEAARCPTCYGLGECDDMHPGDIMCNRWSCRSCGGTGLVPQVQEFSTLTNKIESAVKEALADATPADKITAPLLNMLARVIVGVHVKTGADASELLDVAVNELTEAVAHYVAHNPPAD